MADALRLGRDLERPSRGHCESSAHLIGINGRSERSMELGLWGDGDGNWKVGTSGRKCRLLLDPSVIRMAGGGIESGWGAFTCRMLLWAFAATFRISIQP